MSPGRLSAGLGRGWTLSPGLLWRMDVIPLSVSRLNMVSRGPISQGHLCDLSVWKHDDLVNLGDVVGSLWDASAGKDRHRECRTEYGGGGGQRSDLH